MDLGERISPSSVSDLRITLFNVEPLSDARTPMADFFSILLSDTVPGRSYRQIRIERQVDFGRAAPSKNACAKNSDLIQHHQGHGHQEHGKEGRIRRD